MLLYLKTHNIITRQQHGFLARSSTTSNILDSLNDWTLAINNKNFITVAYVDYSTAFDVVCHSKLMHRLQHYGIVGDLLNWVGSFVSGRTQRTNIGSAISDQVFLSSGVVQASCIGPLLFILYINHVVGVTGKDCQCKLYADDLKIYSEIKTQQDEICCKTVLMRSLTWSRDWQLITSNKNVLS